jgi:hypothetical protein
MNTKVGLLGALGGLIASTMASQYHSAKTDGAK